MYPATVLLSAFLLFLVQPMIARRILPAFGGSTAVWTTCMLFFQVLLLLGYLYADRLARRASGGLIHVALLGASLALLPLTWTLDPARWASPGGDPTVAVLAVLAATVGIPYFLLSTTGPLVQAWFAREHRGEVPYRLFSLSNLGSFAGLLSYPLAIEPAVGTSGQLQSWAAGYACFAACAGWLALRSRAHAPLQPTAAEAAEPPPASQQVLWLLFAATSSAMLLAVTNHLTQNIAPIPFLWVLPLSLYLLTFVLSFGRRDTWRKREVTHTLAVVALGAMAWALCKVDPDSMVRVAIPVLLTGLFLVCLFCHGELAARKPPAAWLTRFYVMLSIGGAVGGLMVAVAAPAFLKGVYELSIAMVFCAGLALAVNYKRHWLTDVAWTAACVSTLSVSYGEVTANAANSREMRRNFYGAVRVTEEANRRNIVHGTINHGIQRLEPNLQREPTTYYGRRSGVGLAIESIQKSPRRVGGIGLGAGTIAVYTRPGDVYRFYEINPQVVDLALSHFTFLSGSPAPPEVRIGDGRLLLSQEDPQNYDVLAVDAFSGDSIPVHLLTLEAMQLYRRHLKPDGILALHVSNTHLDLRPVVARLAQELKLPAHYYRNDGDDATSVFVAEWVLIPMSGAPPAGGKPLTDTRGLRLWTDDYSNLAGILKR